MTPKKCRIHLRQTSGWHEITRGPFTKSTRIQTIIINDNSYRAYMYSLGELENYVGAGGCEIPTTLFARGSNEVLFYKVEAPRVTTEVEPSGRRMGIASISGLAKS
jgi:hypothetical protein